MSVGINRVKDIKTAREKEHKAFESYSETKDTKFLHEVMNQLDKREKLLRLRLPNFSHESTNTVS